MENDNWRINFIPHCNPYAPMETNWGAVLGAVLFVGGIFAGFKVPALFSISVLGFILGLFSILFKNRLIRRNWKKVSARCTDKEWKQVWDTPGMRGGASKAWAFRLLCEFEFQGKTHTVTPAYWSSFISENRVTQFLEKVVSKEGQCQLWVNPKNPLQTELCADDIAELLLH